MTTIAELETKWKASSDESMDRVLAAGGPPNAVTEERMRYLVLKWTLEIDTAKREAQALVWTEQRQSEAEPT